MSITNEIERLQTAKETLKTKLNAKNDSEHQITNELISEYGNFVDNISTGVDIDEYYDTNIKKQPMQNGSGRIFRYIKKLPQLDTSKSINLYEFLSGCSSLTSVPQLDTSNVTVMVDMFYNCSSLMSIPQLDASKAISINTMFLNNSNLTNFGGLLNLGQAYSTSANANKSDYKLYLSDSTKLTHESLMNVINGLYDIKTKGCNTQSLTLGSTNIAKLPSEEIAIATNKGWTVN